MTYYTPGADELERPRGDAQSGGFSVGSLATGGDVSAGSPTGYLTGGTDMPAEAAERQRSIAGNGNRRTGFNTVNAGLVKKAKEIVNSIVPEDQYETQLFLTALVGTVSEMWESAASASQWHQDILAVLQSAAKSSEADGTATAAQLGFFREALTDLGLPNLVRQHAVAIRSEFVAHGFPPLPFAE